MLDFDGDIFLPHSVFIHDEILAAQIWQEIPVGVFNVQFHGHRASRRDKHDFRSLRALLSLVERSLGPVWNGNRGFLPRLLSWCRRFLNSQTTGAAAWEEEDKGKHHRACDARSEEHT